jgi:hypothetical protein
MIGSALPDDNGWSRSDIYVYEEWEGYQGNDRIEQAYGVRYASLTAHLDVTYYVAKAEFHEGGPHFSVGRRFDLVRLALPREIPFRIPLRFCEDPEFHYPGQIDVLTPEGLHQRALELAQEDFRTDPLFAALIALL